MSSDSWYIHAQLTLRARRVVFKHWWEFSDCKKPVFKKLKKSLIIPKSVCHQGGIGVRQRDLT